MCGIIGINEQNEKAVRDGAACFAYRGPDAHQVFSDGAVTLGHNRLSIIDLDPRSSQPMRDADGTLEIVFNGEIFNFKDIKAQLEKKYAFKTTSDTEVLLYAYKEWGTDLTSHVQGMFAFAIYDVPAKKIVLFRDHAGIKPLYYYAQGGVFIFSSEIKGVASLLRAKQIAVEVDESSLDLYYAFGYVPSPQTLYKGIVRLPKSSYLEYDLTKKTVTEQAVYSHASPKITDFDDYKKLVEKKVIDHLIADVPVGVFFSGGTDSSLIAAILHKHEVNLAAFSIRMSAKKEDEFYFKKISEHLGITSHVFDFGIGEFDEIYADIMNKIDEPSSDNSIFPTYFVSKKAAESGQAKVVLSGEGGDEYFYGYPRDCTLLRLNDRRDFEITLSDRIFFALPSFKGKNKLFEHIFAWLAKPVSYYLLHMSPARDIGGIEGWHLAKAAAKNGMAGIATKPLELDQEFYLENDLLRKTDMATSYVSIEGRVPLLDADIIAGARGFLKMSEDGLKRGTLKPILKKILADYLPHELVYRGKSGFGMDMKNYFKQSKFLRADLEKASAYLAEKNYLPEKMADAVAPANLDATIAKYPNLCFSLISLYYALTNSDF